MITFVGAGPGDPDLITVKGRKALEDADIVIYAGSLVSPEHLEWVSPSCEIYNSAEMDLPMVLDVMYAGERDGKKIVRLHTGDPTIYGAIQEQMDELEKKNIPYTIIPGVSSFTAAASAIQREFTLPGVSQTVILTRIAGRTSVPEKENLVDLAKHQASMALFLSVGNMRGVVEALIEGYGRDDVPVAVVYRATWDDEKIIFGRLKTIEEKVKDAQIIKQAQILVGDFINTEYEKSKLYDPHFTTEFRIGENS